MPTNLTAAELEELEAAHDELIRDVAQIEENHRKGARDAGGTMLTVAGLTLFMQYDVPALLTALREARALVEALVDDGPPVCENYCADCCGEWNGKTYAHAPDCAWENARKALAAWNAAPHDQLPE